MRGDDQEAHKAVGTDLQKIRFGNVTGY